jgi:flavoprotein
MGSNILEKIHHQYKMLDIKWILTGEGEMLIHSYQVLEASQEARVNESI